MGHKLMLSYVAELETLSITEAEEVLLNYADKLLEIKLEDLPETSVRVQEVEDLTESFFCVFEQQCNQYILSKLSDYLLLDFIKNDSKAKSKQDDSFHSSSQTSNRRKAEVPLAENTMDHFNLKNSWNIAFKKSTKELEEV
ncbi:hypothetical protein [uncultured Vagococcus sp.]|uniref:hypothetical protein n=1 Tax=uncultured Vagococcus sp. TaxID=189676 RepID=UPI002583DE79|nr:hypothetical protein [uncultured Vagococcus sp.]